MHDLPRVANTSGHLLFIIFFKLYKQQQTQDIILTRVYTTISLLCVCASFCVCLCVCVFVCLCVCAFVCLCVCAYARGRLWASTLEESVVCVFSAGKALATGSVFGVGSVSGVGDSLGKLRPRCVVLIVTLESSGSGLGVGASLGGLRAPAPSLGVGVSWRAQAPVWELELCVSIPSFGAGAGGPSGSSGSRLGSRGFLREAPAPVSGLGVVVSVALVVLVVSVCRLAGAPPPWALLLVVFVGRPLPQTCTFRLIHHLGSFKVLQTLKPRQAH